MNDPRSELGEIIYVPQDKPKVEHRCSTPPSRAYLMNTRWQCAECGTVWVNETVDGNHWWSREAKHERKLRLRAQRRGEGWHAANQEGRGFYA